MKPGDIVVANVSGCPWWMSDQDGVVISIDPKPKPVRDVRRKKDIQPGPAANIRWLNSGHSSNTSVSMLDIKFEA